MGMELYMTLFLVKFSLRSDLCIKLICKGKMAVMCQHCLLNKMGALNRFLQIIDFLSNLGQI